MKKSILSKIIMWVLMVGIFLLPISPSLEIKNISGKVEFSLNFIKKIFAEEICTVNSVNFSPYGDQPKDWYKDNNPPKYEVSFETKNCIGKILEISLVEDDIGLDDDIRAQDDTDYSVTQENFTISYTAGETECDQTGGSSNDCDLYIKVDIEDAPNYSSEGQANGKGELRYDCDGYCGNDTKVNESTGAIEELNLDCDVFNIGGCIAKLFFIFFQISAFVAKLAGQFLDFLVYYSTNSTSYQNKFISTGWGAVRDIANIFFIIALLYIAIKMILSIDDHHGKKMITTIIMVALIINFSMFITQVVIDGSNILAKVFYNNIDSKYENKDSAIGAEGEKSISVGLVSKFNPQRLVTPEVYKGKGGIPLFIFITILATLIVLYAAYIFFSVGLLFVSRVVMLWFSMIFAPIAFASYALPFEIPGLGHRDWWKNLFENAFLAPLFIFMLYIIVMFAEFLNTIISYPEDADTLQKAMSVIIPFVLLAVLLKKAKELAVKYAGEMGGAVQKFGSFVGGAAVGVAAGGAGMLGRASLGRWGSMIGNSEKLKAIEAKGGFGGFMAARLRDTGNKAGKGSFDVRGVKIAGKNLASTTGLQVGSAQSGGFEKRRADTIAKRQRRAESLKVGEDSEIKQKLNKTEEDLHSLNAIIAADIASIDNDIEGKMKDIVDINNEIKAAKTTTDKKMAQDKLKAANDFIAERKLSKKNLRNGESYTTIKRDEYGNEEKDPNGNLIYESKNGHNVGIDGKGKPIGVRQLEDLKKKQTFDFEEENHHRMEHYAESQSSGVSQTFDFLASGGQHSFRGAREASYKIRTGAKVPSAPTKSHDDHAGGSHGGGGHSGGGGHAGGSHGGGGHSGGGGHGHP